MSGKLLKVADIELDGNVEIVTSLKVENLSSHTQRSAQVPLTFTLPEGANIEKMYLDMTVIGETSNWRVYIGDFSLTKEFKPTISRKLKDVDVHKFIFDVTPTKHVVASDPVLRVINNASSPISLVQSTLVIFYSYKDLGTASYYYGISMEPFKALTGTLDPNLGAKIYSVIYSKDKNTVKAKVGACENSMSFVDVEEIGVECSKGGSYVLEGEKEFIPLTLIVGSFSYNLPRLSIAVAKEGGKLKLTIENKGGKADNVLLIVYSSGAILERKTLGEVAEGAVKEAEVDVGNSKDKLVLGIRVLWTKGKIRGVVDKLVPL